MSDEREDYADPDLPPPRRWLVWTAKVFAGMVIAGMVVAGFLLLMAMNLQRFD